MKMLLMARFTFIEALHKRVVHGVLLLTVAFLLLYGLGAWLAVREMGAAGPIRMFVQQYILLGMNSVSGIGALLAIFLSVGTISSEVDAGTLHAIVTKPLTRRDVLWGKWLGYAAMLTVYMMLLFLSVGGVVALFSGIWLEGMLRAALPMVLQSLVLLSISVIGTTFIPTIANGVIVFGLYTVAMMSGFVEQLGVFFKNQTMIDIGIVVSLLVPSDAMVKLSSAILQEGATYFERAGPFIVLSEPSHWMVVYALLYIVVLLLAAQHIFSKKDL
ncbi:MAG: ABC transporter permease subunit [Chloroflexota bacterium]|jgi:Cu-processing system permease protein